MIRARLAILTASALLLAGCQLLFPGYADFPGAFEEPEPVATWEEGSATISIDGGERILLDRLSAGPHLWTVMGTDVAWSSDDGWHVRLTAMGAGFPGGGEFLVFDRIVDGSHWTTQFGLGDCDVDLEQSDEDGLRGTASCEGLRWIDALGSPMMAEQPPFIEGEEPFDAEVTFEASR